VLAGKGAVRVRAETAGGVEEREVGVSHPGAYPLIEHERHTGGLLELELEGKVRCLATCFTPGLAPEA
jgi:hypothetical protein